MTNNNNSYYSANFPRYIQTSLEAGAFRALCQHLNERSDEVQNIDLMTVSGFCRNCLSKVRLTIKRSCSLRNVVHVYIHTLHQILYLHVDMHFSNFSASVVGIIGSSDIIIHVAVPTFIRRRRNDSRA